MRGQQNVKINASFVVLFFKKVSFEDAIECGWFKPHYLRLLLPTLPYIIFPASMENTV